ncbi:ClpP/crotonase [Tilletiaria anomala UBC 951]|uniref:ClpP/crotonase n=1 Tax=Tilletiaria anomala (strain ATCC 24038 / CBS 436.72 / UBC 951) TaxID=1037660 RepID=A0A066VVR4_TILAU|nr:ClpP/crotonase [Tilletiaria anomala UBC 951]KDN45591.1 ClpP/crotonase [Tilletiaria anomala UBC 951]
MSSFALYFPGATTTTSSLAGALSKPSTVRLTVPSPGLFLLTFTGGETPDNRLTAHFLSAFLEALEYVQAKWEAISDGNVEGADVAKGAALVTTGQTEAGSKFFSNGLDLEAAIADPEFFDKYLNPVYAKLMRFPIPTVASLGGHAFAAGFGLAMAHDYRVMSGRRGFLCMNEIHFGAQIPAGLLAALQSKIPSAKTIRKVVLEGHRFDGKEALALSLVDHLAPAPAPDPAADKSDGGGAAKTLEAAVRLAASVRKLASKDAWGSNKDVLYAPYLAILRAV